VPHIQRAGMPAPSWRVLLPFVPGRDVFRRRSTPQSSETAGFLVDSRNLLTAEPTALSGGEDRCATSCTSSKSCLSLPFRVSPTAWPRSCQISTRFGQRKTCSVVDCALESFAGGSRLLNRNNSSLFRYFSVRSAISRNWVHSRSAMCRRSRSTANHRILPPRFRADAGTGIDPKATGLVWRRTSIVLIADWKRTRSALACFTLLICRRLISAELQKMRRSVRRSATGSVSSALRS